MASQVQAIKNELFLTSIQDHVTLPAGKLLRQFHRLKGSNGSGSFNFYLF